MEGPGATDDVGARARHAKALLVGDVEHFSRVRRRLCKPPSFLLFFFIAIAGKGRRELVPLSSFDVDFIHLGGQRQRERFLARARQRRPPKAEQRLCSREAVPRVVDLVQCDDDAAVDKIQHAVEAVFGKAGEGGCHVQPSVCVGGILNPKSASAAYHAARVQPQSSRAPSGGRAIDREMQRRVNTTATRRAGNARAMTDSPPPLIGLRDLPLDLQARLVAAILDRMPVDRAVFAAAGVARFVVGPQVYDPAFDAAYQPACARAGLKTAVCGTWRATYEALVDDLQCAIGRDRQRRNVAQRLAVLESPSIPSDARRSLLCDACLADWPLLLRLLLRVPASEEDTEWLTERLSDAVEYSSPNCMSVLIEAGADPAGRHGCGELLVAFAANREALEEMEILLDAGAPLHDDNDVDPLFSAAFGGAPSTVSRLLERGADPHRLHRDGRTILIAACQEDWLMTHDDNERGKAKIVPMLLDAQVDVNAHDKHGRSALAYARVCGYMSIVAQLRAARRRQAVVP